MFSKQDSYVLYVRKPDLAHMASSNTIIVVAIIVTSANTIVIFVIMPLLFPS